MDKQATPRIPPRSELTELMQELRIAIPGVQVLFAFLLTLPFTGRFSSGLTTAQKSTYFVAFAAAAIASILLIAPSALHRLYHELNDPGGLASLLELSNRLAIAGTVFLAIAMAAVVFLVTDIVYQQAIAAAATAVLVGLVGWFWFALPFVRRSRTKRVD
jgi:hypothetical protein